MWVRDLSTILIRKPGIINISKGSSNFGPAMFIEAALADALAKLKAENFPQGSPWAQFVERAAFYLGEIDAIHPFHEGNGQTQREFILQLAVQAGHMLSWAGFTQEQIVTASILSHTRGDHGVLTAILERVLDPIRRLS